MLRLSILQNLLPSLTLSLLQTQSKENLFKEPTFASLFDRSFCSFCEDTARILKCCHLDVNRPFAQSKQAGKAWPAVCARVCVYEELLELFNISLSTDLLNVKYCVVIESL